MDAGENDVMAHWGGVGVVTQMVKVYVVGGTEDPV